MARIGTLFNFGKSLWKSVSQVSTHFKKAIGEWDMVFWVDVQTPEELEKFVQKKLWGQKWVSDTHSSWAKEIWNKKAA